jgi:DNA polymerase-3 subunit epsilon
MNNLESLNALFIDIQTTGANPEKGDIIEIGWAKTETFSYGVADPKGIETFLIKLPEGQKIPKRTQSITGICEKDLTSGFNLCDVWKKLLGCAESIAQSNKMKKCPTIIHFAKFERPFLRNLHKQNTPGFDFPFFFICTHEIAKRILPGLPRRGIRAVAGYFGHSVAEQRRCQDHIVATAIIWRELVKIMEEKHNITTVSQLMKWLKTQEVCVHPRRIYPMDTRSRYYLPDKPGVYRMLRSNGDVLYVGKASSLSKRVNSYFKKHTQHPEHILEMLSQARQLDVTATGSSLEAAILESDEIKKLCPPYNVALRTRERDVWFCSADLKKFCHKPSRSCRIGPLTSQGLTKGLATIKELVEVNFNSWSAKNHFLSTLGISRKYTSDTECIKDGFDIFVKQHSQHFYNKPIEYAFNELGKKLWLAQSAGKNEIDGDNESEEELRTAKPQSIANRMEWIVLRSTHEIRRARWLVWLTESTLAWEERKTQRLLLVFDKGKVVKRNTISSETKIPEPPGCRKSFVERQRSFDLATIDRMRVVTTEIKKIVSAGKWINICLVPGVVLESKKLVKLLKWI